MTTKIIFTDIDNTLYDWPSFFAPSFRAMVHALSRELSIPEDSLISEFKAVFGAHQSLEYAFAIQELTSVKSLDTEAIRKLIGSGRGAFLSVQRKRLKPYVGVVETLTWLNQQGYEVIGVTNSPTFLAQKRLYDLRLDSLLTGLVAWEGFTPTANDSNSGFVPLSEKRSKSRIKKVISVPISSCKPSKSHYQIALDEFGGNNWEAWVIGDSLHKDLVPASELGITTIWAKYGSNFDPSHKDTSTLLKITHWTKSQIEVNHNTADFSPDYSIDAFEEIKSIIPELIPQLF